MELERRLSRIPSYSRELGLDLRKPRDRFKWFLASMLFAKRISSEIARKTYKLFEAEGLTTPDALLRAGWDKLVEVLDAGGYVRYDFSTATNHTLCRNQNPYAPCVDLNPANPLINFF